MMTKKTASTTTKKAASSKTTSRKSKQVNLVKPAKEDRELAVSFTCFSTNNAIVKKYLKTGERDSGLLVTTNELASTIAKLRADSKKQGFHEGISAILQAFAEEGRQLDSDLAVAGPHHPSRGAMVSRSVEVWGIYEEIEKVAKKLKHS